MHEMSITRNIVAILSDEARGRTVQRVQLEIGQLSMVLPDAIRFCFDVVAAGTVLEGAELEIVEIEGRARCRACDQEVALDPSGFTRDACCAERSLERVAGEELNIKEMQLE